MEDEKKYLREFQKLDDETRKLIKKYDDNIYENKITDGKRDLLVQICKRLENQGSPLKEYFEKEIYVCGFQSITDYFCSKDLIKKNISNNYISWYIFREKRVKHNYLLRGKYCWIIFCLENSKYKYAKKLIRYCKYITLIYIGNSWISVDDFLTNKLIIECIKVSFECVHYLRDRKSNNSLLNYAISLLKRISSDKNLFIINQIKDAIIDDLKYYDDAYRQKFVYFLYNLYKNYTSDIRFYDRTEDFLNILVKIFKNDSQKVKCLKNRIARLYMKFAKLAGGLLGYSYYEMAARIYQEIGEHDKKDKALKMMARINPKDYMAKIEMPVDLSSLNEAMKKKTADFIAKKKSIQDITSYIEIPSIHAIINPKNNTSSITDLLQTVIFSPGSSTKIKAENKKIYDFYQFYLNSYLVVKGQFYKSLIEHKIFTIENLAKYFKKDNLGVDLYLFLLEGMNYFIFNQSHAALFILIPQIENIIKKLAEKAGIPIKKIVLEGEQEKTLGEYFLDEKFVEVLGLDFNTYCFWFLADKTGLNLRNIVAHGFIKYRDFLNHILIGLLEIIIRLIEILLY